MTTGVPNVSAPAQEGSSLVDRQFPAQNLNMLPPPTQSSTKKRDKKKDSKKNMDA
jgi:hypothetical protein